MPSIDINVCSFCGFDGLRDGGACPLCGRDASRFTESPTVIGDSAAPGLESADTPDPGALVAGRYRVIRLLGRGGMGTVFEAEDQTSRARRAVKILHLPAGVSDQIAQRFRREAAVMARIDHPGVPRLHEAMIEKGRMILVTDFVEGTSLREVIRERGIIPPAEAAEIAARIADALNAAHEQGVIHRDVKPHNVMIVPGGGVRLLDFGVAREVGFGAERITSTGGMVGTPHYMSPEQFAGPIDARSDIYSVGIVLFEMTTGRLPFDGDTAVALARQHADDLPHEPRSLREDLPAWLNRAILRCLEKEPRDRYATAADLAFELRRPRQSRPRIAPQPNGDRIIEDDGDAWALVLSAPKEKPGWSPGMTLLFHERPYLLEEALFEEGRFLYRFSFSPEGEVYRKVVEYDGRPTPPSLGDKLRKWLR